MDYSTEKIRNFLKDNYNLNSDKIELLGSGAMNSNYAFEAGNKKYLFRIYDFKGKNQVDFEVEVLKFLKEKDFPGPRLKSSVNNELVLVFQNRPCVLYNYIDGENIEKMTSDLMHQIGEIEARMHILLKDFRSSSQKQSWDPKELKILVHENRENMIAKEFPETSQLIDFVETELRKYEFPENLPVGVTHQDIKPENIIIKNEKVVGIIDFDNSYTGVLLHDITTTIIWTCFVDERLDTDLLNAFLGGYNKKRQLTELEKKYLLDSIKFRLVREVFIGPFVTMHLPELSKERTDYFTRLYKKFDVNKNEFLHSLDNL